jgi:hypothetical protein
VRVLLIFSFLFFSAQIAEMKCKQDAQETAASGSKAEDARVERPKLVKGVQKAMQLDDRTYRNFCVSL